ncbi:hypothetical protein BDI24065_02426 [Burkholderia diffusa]|uniref:Uncharacterized protein n=1 Tax=Burkholderia diffusa TaxID=488732 RepID=A0A6P2KBM4_9BURK|nr:hypothetical protein BDI24065_02426 [Burkholderia diffusa]
MAALLNDVPPNLHERMAAWPSEQPLPVRRVERPLRVVLSR